MSKFHLDFDGAGYITLPTNAPKYSTNDFSIEIRYRVPVSGGGGCLYSAFMDVGIYAFGVKITVDPNGKPTAVFAAWSQSVSIVCSGDFAAGAWYHAVLSCDRSGSAQWLINGETRNSEAISQLPDDVDAMQKYVGVLHNDSYGVNPETFIDYFTGDIYNLGYYVGKDLSAGEAQARYQAVDFAGTEDGLSWASNMNQGSGVTVYDVLAVTDATISSLDHVTWQVSDIPFTPPYEMIMRHVPGRGNLRSIVMPPFGGVGGLVPGFRIYRGQDGIIDYDNIVATMGLDDTQATITGQDLPPGTTWHYVRREVKPCGLESPDSPPCVVVIDSNGDMIGKVPNLPLSLTIEKLAGAKFKLRWRYTPIKQEVEPTGFNIYKDSGSGFDFESPEATVAHNQGINGEYSWTSGTLTDGQLYRFCVRSYRTAEGESQNTDSVSAVADSVGPDAITTLSAAWEEVPA